MGCMYLYAVEACFDSVACCPGVQANVFCDLRDRKFARNDYFPVARMSEGDGARGDEIEATFLLEDSRIGNTSERIHLEENVRAIGVDGIRNLYIGGQCTK